VLLDVRPVSGVPVRGADVDERVDVTCGR